MSRAEYMKEYMRKKRDVNKSVNKPDVNKGMLTDNLGYQYKVLTDGQHWYPGRHGYHPEGCTCGIEHKERPAD